MAKRAAEIWFVYILRCVDGTLYTGITKDLARRCQQHNDGAASRYTRSRRPVKLVYQEPQRQPKSGVEAGSGHQETDTAAEVGVDPRGHWQDVSVKEEL